MRNTEISCIKYLCHNRRKVSNKEACVCALTPYRANNTAFVKETNYVINKVNVNIL
jgi:hypothetical protein